MGVIEWAAAVALIAVSIPLMCLDILLLIATAAGTDRENNG